MESAYLKYASDREQQAKIFSSVQKILVISSLAFLLILFLIEGPLIKLMSLPNDLEYLYYMMAGILISDALTLAPFAELRLIRKTIHFSVVKLVNVGINLSLNFYLVLGLNWGIEAVVISNLIASAFTAIYLNFYFTSSWFGGFEKEIVQKVLKFGLPYIPAGVGYAVNEVMDRFFINNMPQSSVDILYGSDYTSEAITGIYNACYKLAIFMVLFVQMYRMAWQPFFLRHASSSDNKRTYKDAFLWFNVFAAVALLVISLFKEEIVAIRVPFTQATLIDSDYWLGLPIVPVLMLAYWFQGWYVNFMAGIFIKEKTAILPFVMLSGAGVTIIANSVLVDKMGMMGSAIATLLSYMVMTLMIYLATCKYFPITYSWIRVWLMMALTLGLLFANHFFINYYDFTVMKSVLLLIGLAGIIIISGLPKKLYQTYLQN